MLEIHPDGSVLASLHVKKTTHTVIQVTREASLDVSLSGANQSGAIAVHWPFCKVTDCIG